MVGRPLRGNEEGFTIVELVVALTVMAVGIFGLMRVYAGTLQTSAAADVRSSATAIATAELEALRAIPFDDLGFESTDPGYSATWAEGATTFSTVTVAAGRAQTEPVGTSQVRKGETFDVLRRIVWLPSSDGAVDALKRVVVEVSWDDRLGHHVVRQDSAVYPGGRGPASTTTTTTAASPSALTAPTCGAVVQNPTTPRTALDVTWAGTGAADPATWEIRRRAPSQSWAEGVVVTTSLPGANRSFTVTGLSAGTPYVIELRGLSSTGTGDSPVAACGVASTEAAPPTCQVVSASATSTNGNIAVRKNSGGLQQNVAVAVNTTGSCGALRLRFVPTGTSTATLSLASASSTYSTSIGKNAYAWSIGNKLLEVLDASNNAVAVLSLRVCSTSSCST